MSSSVLLVSVLLFLTGLAAAVLRRGLLAMLLGLELMVASVCVALVYHARLFGDPAGLAAAALVITIGAAEAVVGLCLILRLHRSGLPADTDGLKELRD